MPPALPAYLQASGATEPPIGGPYRLDVFLEPVEGPIGELVSEGGQVSFRYDPAYAQDAGAIPLSVRLPLTAEGFDNDATRAFFENLLPEGNRRAALARQHDVDENDVAALLARIGAECAGAVSVLPKNAPQLKRPGRFPVDYVPLTDDDLATILRDLAAGRQIDRPGEQDASLAGVQAKTAVYVDGNGSIHRAVKHAPTTHILKVADAEFPGAVENETFCLRLLGAMGASTAHAEMRVHVDIPFILVRRYDRDVRSTAAGTTVHRLHQEDFAQALGFTSAAKYTHRGGPEADALFSVADQAERPAIFRRDLLRALLYAYLIANSDAHLKNFAVVHRPRAIGGLNLAPLYDQLSVALYPRFRHGMALAVGGQQDYAAIGRAEWAAFARRAGFRRTYVLDEIRRIASIIVPEARMLRKTESAFTDFYAGRVIDAIGQQVRLLSEIFGWSIEPGTAPFHAQPPGWRTPS